MKKIYSWALFGISSILLQISSINAEQSILQRQNDFKSETYFLESCDGNKGIATVNERGPKEINFVLTEICVDLNGRSFTYGSKIDELILTHGDSKSASYDAGDFTTPDHLSLNVQCKVEVCEDKTGKGDFIGFSGQVIKPSFTYGERTILPIQFLHGYVGKTREPNIDAVDGVYEVVMGMTPYPYSKYLETTDFMVGFVVIAVGELQVSDGKLSFTPDLTMFEQQGNMLLSIDLQDLVNANVQGTSTNPRIEGLQDNSWKTLNASVTGLLGAFSEDNFALMGTGLIEIDTVGGSLATGQTNFYLEAVRTE
ncbi:hypothetical protein J7481_22885 [Labrenzia sp. R4_2]|uniref:hypothetical protein n=1 Tax=Labrenzia sp. R4_2 TaxID=2821107 RepID=UPI001ADB3C75|nr:hypothetical protein [Labrenzia sp. R4_2]MBO9422375.1 hypothetical protein [Labrenzia sp. R4_2]